MNHLFIINPAAGSRDRTDDYRRSIEEACRPKGLSYRIEVSQAPGECARIAREAAQTGEEYRIYACGGDGTLNEVVSGAVGFPNVSVTHYAGGSGNDFVKLFSETEPFRDIQRLLDCQETEFDLIRCDKPTPVNLDGELRVAGTVDIRVAKEKLRFFYPKGLTFRVREPAAMG